MCHVHILLPAYACVLARDITFISGVGFRVARSTVPGNARASMRGTSDSENSHAFSYVYVTVLEIRLYLES